ncbi:MAG: anti-sigma factor [Gemmatimonadota bacterium]
MDQERFRDLASKLLLEGLDDAEQAELERELEIRGAEGQAELARLREAIAGIAASAPAAVPSAALRERVLARVENEEGGVGPAVLALRERPAGLAAGRGWMLGAAAAACVALLLAVWNVRLRDRLEEGEREFVEARERAAAADSAAAARVAAADSAAAVRVAVADSAAAVLEAYRRDLEALVSPTGSAHTLVGTENQPGARARVFVDPATSRVILFVYALPVLTPGSVYELWAIRDGTPVAVGTFQTEAGRSARIELPDAGVLAGADTLAVTVEPAPGTAAPTGPMVLVSGS